MSTPTRDLHDNLSAVIAVLPATLTATPTDISVDTLGFRGAMVAFYIGVGGITFTGTNRIDLVLEHSLDNTNWTAVTQADVVGQTITANGTYRSIIALKAAADVTEISYVGGRRYIRTRPVMGGTHSTGTPMAAMIVRGLPEQMPSV
jgi:hypothetical protein